MKVLILTNFGMGLYKFRKELLQELIKLGYDVYISLPNDDYIPFLQDIGCKYIRSQVDRRKTNLISDLMLLFSYIKIIKNIQPDVVLTYTIKPNVYGGIACRMTKVLYISNITGLGTAIENEGLLKKLVLKLYKVGLKNAKCVFFQNEPSRQFFISKGIVKSNTKVIPGSGVNLEQYKFEEYPKNDGIIRFLYIGRIMKAKGIDELLEAAQQIKKKYSNVEFDIVGFCEEDYSKKLKGLNSSGIIRYHGLKNDVREFIKMSNAIILPSYHEGTSNVLLEASSTGRPVLASNITGCKETFDEGISGFGFEAKSTESLINTIIKFIELPYDKKKQMGIAARKKMEREYDRNFVIDAYLEQIIQKGE